MKTPVASESRHHRLREAYRRELGTLGLFIEGTLCKVQRPGRKAPAWQLTFKQAGKTRTVYVPAELDRCTYDARHLWWQMLLTFLLRGGSRNAFDGDRNTGQMPANVARLCGRVWDEARLGARRTVTCSGNAVHHASRVAVCAVAEMPLLMTRRLMQMRLPDGGRLSGRWRLIAVDGTLRDRGRETEAGGARHRYVLAASLAGPFGMSNCCGHPCCASPSLTTRRPSGNCASLQPERTRSRSSRTNPPASNDKLQPA